MRLAHVSGYRPRTGSRFVGAVTIGSTSMTGLIAIVRNPRPYSAGAQEVAGNTQAGSGWAWRTDVVRAFNVIIADGAGVAFTTSSYTLPAFDPANVIHVAAFSYDGTTALINVDGAALAPTVAATPGYTPCPLTMSIGARANGASQVLSTDIVACMHTDAAVADAATLAAIVAQAQTDLEEGRYLSTALLGAQHYWDARDAPDALGVWPDRVGVLDLTQTGAVSMVDYEARVVRV